MKIDITGIFLIFFLQNLFVYLLSAISMRAMVFLLYLWQLIIRLIDTSGVYLKAAFISAAKGKSEITNLINTKSKTNRIDRVLEAFLKHDISKK